MSNLNNKINSFPLERGTEYNQTFTTTPTRTGTNPTTTSVSQNSTSNIVYDAASGPIGGAGSWNLQFSSTAATNSYVRYTVCGSTELLGNADNNYSTGFWFKINQLPTNTASNIIFSLGTTSNSNGLGVSIYGASAASAGKLLISFNGGSITTTTAITVGAWNYFAFTRNAGAINIYVNNVAILSNWSSPIGSSTASTLMFGNTSATSTTTNCSWNISNYYFAPETVIGVPQIADIWTAGTTAVPAGDSVTYANAMTVSATSVDPVITKYSSKIVRDEVLALSPQVFYDFQASPNFSNFTSPANLGTGSTGWSQNGGDSIYPIYNATGGERGNGSYTLTYGGTTDNVPANFKPSGSDTSDYDFGMGFWFKTNFTLSNTLIHDTSYDLISYGENHSGGFICGIQGGAAAASTKGKLTFTTVGGGSTFSSPSRIDDQKWHYIYVNTTSNGAISTTLTYLDGILINTQTATIYGGTKLGGIAIGDYSTTTTNTGSLEATTFEFDKLIIGTAAGFTITHAKNIEDIATSTYVAPPGVSVSHTAEPMNVTTSTLVMPTIVTVIGDHVEITTSVLVSAYMPDAGFSSGSNTTINASALTASGLQNDVTLDTNRDAIVPTTPATATTIFPEPLVSRPALLASATMPGGVASVAPNYFSMVKNQNPVYYIEDGQSVPHNYGTWTQTGVTTNQYFDSNVASNLEMNAVGNHKSWEANSAGIILHNPLFQPTVTNYKDNINALYSSRNLSIEIWYYSIGHGSVVNHLSYEESGPIFNDGLTQISEVWDFFGCVPGSDPQNKIMLISERLHSYDINDPLYYSTWRSYPDANPKRNEWNHLVVTYEAVTEPTQVRRKIYLNGGIVGNELLTLSNSSINAGNGNAFGDDGYFQYQTVQSVPGPTLGGVVQLSGSQDIKLHDGVQLDEFAIYPVTLSTSQVIDHYSFIKSLSPNTSYTQTSVEALAKMGNHIVTPVMNVEYQESPFSALVSRIPEPVIIGGKSKNVSVGPIEATIESIDPAISYGFTNFVDPITAYAEEASAYALNSIYADYVNTNVLPYRYVNFDSSNAYLDQGSDEDYAVAAVQVLGTIVNPDEGINGKSAKTSGQSITNGVILMESEYNDTWGTGANNYHSSFWMQRSIDDTSTTGARVLWNLNGAKDNQHVILYQYQNKLWLNFNNGSGTHIEQSTVSSHDLFDYNRHFIVIDFAHSGQSNVVSLYVDGILVMQVSLGSYNGQTINSDTYLAPNDEANNFPRLGVGCLITPFADTALSVFPTNIKIYVDEIVWAKSAATQTLVTNLYNTLPGKTNAVVNANAMQSTGVVVTPSLSTEIVRFAPVLEAIMIATDPALITEKNTSFAAQPADASARIVETQRSDSVTLVWDVMLASVYLGGGGTPRVVTATPITASAALQNRKISTGGTTATNYPIKVNGISTFDPESAWSVLVRTSTVDTMDLIREVI